MKTHLPTPGQLAPCLRVAGWDGDLTVPTPGKPTALVFMRHLA